MANGFDGEKQFPFPLVEKGKGYSKALKSRATAILETLMGFLASNYRSSIPSNEYSVYLKAISTELARFTLAIEELSTDISFDLVRSEFLNQVIGRFIFLDEQPDLDLNDEEFREFLLTIIDIFFQGSTPNSIKDAVTLFTDQEFEIRELYKEARSANSVYDISNQFSFMIEFDLDNQFPDDVFVLQHNIKLLLNLVKPAHTLYKISHVFKDIFDKDKLEDLIDEGSWKIQDYRYDDIRKYCGGMKGFDSASGYIEQDSLTILQDDWNRAPLRSVKEGVTLLVPNGVNRGRYTVSGYDETLKGIQVKPRFQEAEEDFYYKVEVDRLGSKKEIFVGIENVSSQFISSEKLIVTITGPTDMIEGETEIFTAASNFSGTIQVEWDLTGDNNFNNETTTQVSLEAPPVPVGQPKGYLELGVRVTTKDGRSAKTFHLITIHPQP